MDGVNKDDDRECHWKMLSKDNDGGVDDRKALLHDKRLDVSVNEKGNIIKWVFSEGFWS